MILSVIHASIFLVTTCVKSVSIFLNDFDFSFILPIFAYSENYFMLSNKFGNRNREFAKQKITYSADYSIVFEGSYNIII